MGEHCQADTTHLSISDPDQARRGTAYTEVTLLGCRFHLVTAGELLSYIVASALHGQQRIVANVNVKALNLAQEKQWFKEFLNRADLVFCDGVGVLLGARLLGYTVSLQHRMTCPDFIGALAMLCERQGLSMYLLAGEPGVAEAARARLLTVAPRLKVGAHHGYFQKSGQENNQMLAELAAFSPDILLVGFGMPLQERWIVDNLSRISASVLLPLGACLDFYIGRLYRPPRWFTDHGLEWLGRLLTENPRRVWGRYLVGNPLFLWRVLKQRFGLLRLPEDV